MKELDVTTAYNLDGGGSSTMYFNGQIINKPTTNGRISKKELSDVSTYKRKRGWRSTQSQQWWHWWSERCMNSSATKSTPHSCTCYLIPLVLGVVLKSRSKNDQENLESEDAEAAYKMGVLTFIFGRKLKSLRHLRHKLSLPNPLLTSRCPVLLVAALGLGLYYKKAVAK